MPARTEVLRDGTIGGEKSLGLARGLKPLHVSLALTGRLVRILCAIVEIPMLAMVHRWEQFTLGGCVALQFIGNDHPGHVQQAFEQLAHELLRRPLIPASLDKISRTFPF
jgi:hypothetical protein